MSLPAKPRDMEALAAELQREHTAFETAARSAVRHAQRCGELLSEAKAQLAHGAWLPWLEEHFAGSQRTAQAYMQLAREDPQRLAHFGVREALSAIAEPRPSPSGEPPPPPLDAQLKSLAATSDEGALDEVLVDEPDGDPGRRFPAKGVEWRTWENIRGLLDKGARLRELAKARDQSDWSRADAVEQAGQADRKAGEVQIELARFVRGDDQ